VRPRSGLSFGRGDEAALASRQTAGPPLTPNQLRAAILRDGPNGQWKGGEFERIEAKNRALFKAHLAKLAGERLIQPHHPPVNIVGGYGFPDAPAIDLSPVKPASVKSVARTVEGSKVAIGSLTVAAPAPLRNAKTEELVRTFIDANRKKRSLVSGVTFRRAV
jgi:hypothetical protein